MSLLQKLINSMTHQRQLLICKHAKVHSSKLVAQNTCHYFVEIAKIFENMGKTRIGSRLVIIVDAKIACQFLSYLKLKICYKVENKEKRSKDI